MRVLIADDDAVTARRLRGLAESWDYEATVTTDGPSTLAILENPDPPRLVLLDWVMPGMDGIDVCQRIRQLGDGQHAYVIMLTARGEHDDMLAGFAARQDPQGHAAKSAATASPSATIPITGTRSKVM